MASRNSKLQKTKLILFVCYGHQKEHFFHQHGEYLQKNGLKVSWFIIDDDSNGVVYSRRGLSDLRQLTKDIALRARLTQPNLVISITPKGGLAAAIASKIAGINHLHWFTGQIWSNYRLPFKLIYSIPDRIINFLAKNQLVDGHPQKKYLAKNLFNKKRLKVIGKGSINGAPTYLQEIPVQIPIDKITIGIVGRICKDKGFDQLSQILNHVLYNKNTHQIVIFGDMDENSVQLKKEILELIRSPCYDIIWHGQIQNKRMIYSSMDVLLSLSYREGFSNVMIEAQYAAKPVLARRIYATGNTIIEGKTGEFFENADDLFEKLTIICNDYSNYSTNARQYVKTNFDQNVVVEAIVREYLEILECE